MSSDPRWTAVLVLAAALLLWRPRADPVVRRARVAESAGRPGTAGRARGSQAGKGVVDQRRRWVLAGAAALATGVLTGGGTGVVVAVVVAVGVERLLRRSGSGQQSGLGTALVRDLPGACDLIGVCLAAGVPVAGALTAVGAAVPGPLGAQLRTVGSLYRLGAEPRRAWADVPGELAALGRILVRAGESGSGAVPALRSLAADSRSAARTDAEATARRAGVWVLAPLGACFLPAFLCLGVVPLVLGIAGQVFG